MSVGSIERRKPVLLREKRCRLDLIVTEIRIPQVRANVPGSNGLSNRRFGKVRTIKVRRSAIRYKGRRPLLKMSFVKFEILGTGPDRLASVRF